MTVNLLLVSKVIIYQSRGNYFPPSGCQRFTTIPLATCSRGESAEWSKYKRKLTKCQVFLDLCNGGARLVPKNSVRFEKSKRKFLVSTDPNNLNYSV